MSVKQEIPTQNLVADDASDIITKMNEDFPAVDSDAALKATDAAPIPDDLIPNSELSDGGVEETEDKSEAKVEDKVEDKTVLDEAKDDFEVDSDLFGDDFKEAPAAEEKTTFDEQKFDSDTETLIKALEEKGHPGDVYKKLRGELKALKQEQQTAKVPEDVQAEIDSLRLKAEEADGLRQKIDDLSSVSAKVRVEQSDEYKRDVLQPAANLISRAKVIAETNDTQPEIIEAIMQETDRKQLNAMIEKHMPTFSELDRQEVYGMIREYGQLSQKRAVMLEDAGKTISSMEAQRAEAAAKAHEESRNTYRTLQDQVWDKYDNVIPGLVDETGQLTPEAAAMKKRAMSIDLSKAQPKDEAYVAFAGLMLPRVMKELQSARNKLAEIDTSDKKEVRSRPSAGVVTDTPSEPGAEDDFLTAMRKVSFS